MSWGRAPNDTRSGMSTKVLLSIAAISSIIASVILRSSLHYCLTESALRHVLQFASSCARAARLHQPRNDHEACSRGQ